jgi:rod shape-determining protein MreC
VLLVITLLAITFVTIDATGDGAFDPVRNTASDVVSPLAGAVGWVTTPFRNAWAGVTGYEDLERENDRLRDELDRMEGLEITEANASEQLKRLQEQLDIGFVGDIPTQVARVTGGRRNNFEDHRVEIDKGSDAGLEVGMPVVTKSGLVGRLERVSKDRSVVQLATDPAFVIGVRLADTQVLGVGHGSGAGAPFVVDRGPELSDEVTVGEAVLTSGLDRSVMPPDVPLGYVQEVVPDESTQTLVLRVRLRAGLSELDVVQVMKWLPPS